MPLILTPVLLRDLPAVHTLSLSADQHSPTAAVLFPNHASATSVAHFTQQDEKDMQDPKSTSRHVIVRDAPNAGAAAEGKGEVVSYAMWNFFAGRGKDEGKEGADGAYYEEWPSDVNREAIAMLMGKAKKKREEIMGSGDYARRCGSLSPCLNISLTPSLKLLNIVLSRITIFVPILYSSIYQISTNLSHPSYIYLLKQLQSPSQTHTPPSPRQPLHLPPPPPPRRRLPAHILGSRPRRCALPAHIHRVLRPRPPRLPKARLPKSLHPDRRPPALRLLARARQHNPRAAREATRCVYRRGDALARAHECGSGDFPTRGGASVCGDGGRACSAGIFGRRGRAEQQAGSTNIVRPDKQRCNWSACDPPHECPHPRLRHRPHNPLHKSLHPAHQPHPRLGELQPLPLHLAPAATPPLAPWLQHRAHRRLLRPHGQSTRGLHARKAVCVPARCGRAARVAAEGGWEAVGGVGGEKGG